MKKWWHEAIGYQIYPKSFQDTNGDGIGDLRGIIQHLDDLVDLGINVLWLSPINQSPMVDHGYDISDYYQVDPVFGSNEDLQELIQQADSRGIKILLDLVINHTSDQHPWFQEALSDPTGPAAQRYIIRHGQDGPPNNWRSIFGGSAWTRIPETDLYYLHLFTKNQPDLNWENPTLRQELYGMVRYWLDQGLGGFRIDAISHIKKDWQYENMPPDSDGLVNGFEYFRNVAGIEAFLDELAENTFRLYDSFTIAEMDDIQQERLAEFIGDQGYFSTVFDFFHTKFYIRQERYAKDPLGFVEELKEELFQRQAYVADQGFMTNFIENHDKIRSPGKFIPKAYINEYSKRLLAVCYFFLRGIPVIYQGQEIGMEDYPKESIHDYLDLATHNMYQEFLDKGMSAEDALFWVNLECRENSRTPMQWDATEQAGFTTGEPWFAVNPNYLEISYAQQRKGNSLLAFYKKVVALRKNEQYRETWIYGQLIPQFEEVKGCIAYTRESEAQRLWVIANCTPQEMRLPLSAPRVVLLNNYEQLDQGTELRLRPGQAIVLEEER